MAHGQKQKATTIGHTCWYTRSNLNEEQDHGRRRHRRLIYESSGNISSGKPLKLTLLGLYFLFVHTVITVRPCVFHALLWGLVLSKIFSRAPVTQARYGETPVKRELKRSRRRRHDNVTFAVAVFVAVAVNQNYLIFLLVKTENEPMRYQ